jgi:hypothetical protein
LFVRAQHKSPWRTNRFEVSLHPTTISTDNTRSTKRARQNSPSPTKQPTVAGILKSSLKKEPATTKADAPITLDPISNHPFIKKLIQDIDTLQGNHLDLTSHIKDGKEQQHVIQTQVLELTSNMTEMNNAITNVVNESQPLKTR